MSAERTLPLELLQYSFHRWKMLERSNSLPYYDLSVDKISVNLSFKCRITVSKSSVVGKQYQTLNSRKTNPRHFTTAAILTFFFWLKKFLLLSNMNKPFCKKHFPSIYADLRTCIYVAYIWAFISHILCSSLACQYTQCR